MSTEERITIAHLDNLAFSLMSRMHVILRRQTGRVTDIDYMRTNPAYCRHLLELGAGSSDQDLQQICVKLQEIYFGPDGLFVRSAPKPPLVDRLTAPAETTTRPSAIAPAVVTAKTEDIGTAVDQGYIGRLR